MTDENEGPYLLFWTTPDGKLVGKAGFISKEFRAEKITTLRADNPGLQFEEREITPPYTSGTEL